MAHSGIIMKCTFCVCTYICVSLSLAQEIKQKRIFVIYVLFDKVLSLLFSNLISIRKKLW